MTIHISRSVIVCSAVAFVVGIAIGSLFAQPGAQAAQSFGPDDVKSVPETFLEGGDRNLAAVKDLSKIMDKNTAAVVAMGETAASIDTTVKSISKQLDETNKALEYLYGPRLPKETPGASRNN